MVVYQKGLNHMLDELADVLEKNMTTTTQLLEKDSSDVEKKVLIADLGRIAHYRASVLNRAYKEIRNVNDGGELRRKAVIVSRDLYEMGRTLESILSNP